MNDQDIHFGCLFFHDASQTWLLPEALIADGSIFGEHASGKGEQTRIVSWTEFTTHKVLHCL
jgi:hypothetical protein